MDVLGGIIPCESAGSDRNMVLEMTRREASGRQEYPVSTVTQAEPSTRPSTSAYVLAEGGD
jgi:hypothetical protein